VLLSVLAIGAIGIVSMVGLARGPYYHSLAIAAAAVAVVSWVLTPASLDRERPAWLIVRWGARTGLALWVPALWSAADPAANRWELLVLEAIGLVGAMLFLAVLASIAREVELLHTARRLTTLAVVSIPIGAFTWIMPFPESRFVLPDGAAGMIGTVFVLFSVAPWYWLLIQTARSAGDLATESQWSARARRDRVKRDAAFRTRVDRSDSVD